MISIATFNTEEIIISRSLNAGNYGKPGFKIANISLGLIPCFGSNRARTCWLQAKRQVTDLSSQDTQRLTAERLSLQRS